MDKKNINEQIKRDFIFINERVVNIKRKRMLKLFSIGISGAVIICGIIWFILWYNDIQLHEVVKSEKERLVIRKNNRRMNTESEDSILDNHKDDVAPISEEKMKQKVTVVSYNRQVGEHPGRAKVITSIHKSGLIVNVSDGVYILVHDDELKKNEVVTVKFSNSTVGGQVKVSYPDLKLALVYVSRENVSQKELEHIEAAHISLQNTYAEHMGILDIGNPVEQECTVKKGALTLSTNVVSIVDAQIQLEGTDILPSHNENGFIFDMNGKVIGISYEDISNHISVLTMSEISNLLNMMIQEEDVPYLGIYGREVTKEVIDTIDDKMSKGIYVSSTEVDSPAYQYGILNGDIIVKVGNKKVTNFDEYNQAVLSLKPNDEAVIVVARKGAEGYKNIEYKIMVGTMPENS